MNVRILLVDDHPMLRGGVRQAMAEQPNLELVGEVSTGAAALKLALELKPDLIVMDVHLPDLNGIEVTRRILSTLSATKIVIFSSDATRVLVDEALEAGAAGYVLKTGAVEDLIHAVDLVMVGKLYLSPEVSTGILEDYRKSLIGEAKASKPVLSDRDKQLLRLIAAGLRSKEIATEMKLSANSIETYRARLLKKIGYASTAELVRYAIREGIVTA